MLYYGISLLLFTTLTFCYFIYSIIKCAEDDDKYDPVKTMSVWMGKYSEGNLEKVRLILQFLPCITSGGLLLIILSFWGLV